MEYFKRVLFEEVRLPEGLILEDLCVTPLIFYNCNRVACIAKPLYFYFQNSSSVLHSTMRQVIDAGVVYCYLANCFSSDAAFSNIIIHLLHTGLSYYRRAFWEDKKALKTYEDYYQKRSMAKKLFRAAWENNKKWLRIDKKDYFYFELFYFSFIVARIACAAKRWISH